MHNLLLFLGIIIAFGGIVWMISYVVKIRNNRSYKTNNSCLDNCMEDSKQNLFNCQRKCGIDTYSDKYPFHSTKECVNSLKLEGHCGDQYNCKYICGDYDFKCVSNCLPDNPTKEETKQCYTKCMD